MVKIAFVFTTCVIVLALVLLVRNFIKIRKLQDRQDANGVPREGKIEMYELAGEIRSGVHTFMKTEYRTIVIVVGIVAVLLTLFVESLTAFPFLLGAGMGTLSCLVGMEAAVYANVRAAAKADKTRSLVWTMKVAMLGGSTSGLAAHGFGLLGFEIVLFILTFGNVSATGTGLFSNVMVDVPTNWLMACSVGYSMIAIFNRVAGGNFTKAADISADILAKIDLEGMEEDDSRNPCVLADLAGDDVNDISGNTSDLSESFVATLVSCVVSASRYLGSSPSLRDAGVAFALLVAASGLLGSTIGIGAFSFQKMRTTRGSYDLTKAAKLAIRPERRLDAITNFAAGFTILASLVCSWILFGNQELPKAFAMQWFSPCFAAGCGIASGIAIGKITEYYTSTEHTPVQEVAKSSIMGAAHNIIMGWALGSKSCFLPITVIVVSLLASYGACGFFGIAAAALGMLSFVAATVSIDAFGPIADNAGGIAEACHLDPEVREITDKLDATGNTTAAIGKGFAIGSAAFATISLVFSYFGAYTDGSPVLSVRLITGILFGVGLVKYFGGLLGENTNRSALAMAEEARKQLQKFPGILDGTEKPRYDDLIELATRVALKKMLLPSILAIVVPLLGFVVGPEFVGGILLGATAIAVGEALQSSNAGGAWDNAKKYIEQGRLEGHPKHSEAHKNAVVGDTNGDDEKDVKAPAYDILIKLMVTTANILVPLFAAYSLF